MGGGSNHSMRLRLRAVGGLIMFMGVFNSQQTSDMLRMNVPTQHCEEAWQLQPLGQAMLLHGGMCLTRAKSEQQAAGWVVALA